MAIVFGIVPIFRITRVFQILRVFTPGAVVVGAVVVRVVFDTHHVRVRVAQVGRESGRGRVLC